MGEILYRTRLSEEMFRGFAPWLNWLPGRLMHVNVLACGVFGCVTFTTASTFWQSHLVGAIMIGF